MSVQQNNNNQLHLLTFNVQSIRDPGKQQLLLTFLSTLSPSPSIIFLQEHHLSESINQWELFRMSWKGHAFFTKHVLTLIPKNSPLYVSPSHISRNESRDGRLLILTFLYQSHSYQFTNYYAPVQPKARLEHFRTVELPRAPRTTIRIVAGDLNDCPEPLIDRQNQTESSRTSHWQILTESLVLPFVDTIRRLHPHAAQFSRPHKKNGAVQSWSRIDYILLGEAHQNLLKSGRTIISPPFSDHRPVYVSILPPSNARRPEVDRLPEMSSQILRINSRVYDDEDFVGRIPPLILAAKASYPNDELEAFEYTMKRLREESIEQGFELNRAYVDSQKYYEHRIRYLESIPDMSQQQRYEWSEAVQASKRLQFDRARQLRIRAHVPELSSEEALSHKVHARLAVRRKQISIESLRLDDGTLSTDINKCLEKVRGHYQAHHTPSQIAQDVKLAAQQDLLKSIRAAGQAKERRFMVPMEPSQSRALDKPFTSDEFVEAIKNTETGRSPGANGLPYEMYRSSPQAFASLLADTSNASWNQGRLPPTMTEGIVRLLQKPKPDADYSDLKYYRPITLRDCSYKLVSKVLVARLNKILPTIMPQARHGFMPRRRAADAGTHLSLLLEHIREGGADWSDSALLSLDQESAYDLVDHDWIYAVFEAFGCSTRFLDLLRVIYGSVSLKYIINGFLTEAVMMYCGLGQGDPVSCPIWNIVFQPYLDALVRRKIALQLPIAIGDGVRSEVLTHLAFADDAIVLVKSAHALALLEDLRMDWQAATNGRSNPAKTKALPLGGGWGQDERTRSIETVPDGEYLKWAGFS